MDQKQAPTEVLIVAVKETAGSALYGMLDVLSADERQTILTALDHESAGTVLTDTTASIRAELVGDHAVSGLFPDGGEDLGERHALHLLDHRGELEHVHVGHAAIGMARVQIAAEQGILLFGRPGRGGLAVRPGIAARDAALAARGFEPGHVDSRRQAGRAFRAGRPVEHVLRAPEALFRQRVEQPGHEYRDLGDSMVLTDEKELGVALIDIGGGTTDLAIFEKGSIWHTAVLPVGVAGAILTLFLSGHSVNVISLIGMIGFLAAALMGVWLLIAILKKRK